MDPTIGVCLKLPVSGGVLGAHGGETAGPPSRLGPSSHPVRGWLCSGLWLPLVPQQETGFWFIFHHVPTGPSVGMYSPGYSEHIPLGKFHNNRAHSNYRVSLSGPPAGPAPRPTQADWTPGNGAGGEAESRDAAGVRAGADEDTGSPEGDGHIQGQIRKQKQQAQAGRRPRRGDMFSQQTCAYRWGGP